MKVTFTIETDEGEAPHKITTQILKALSANWDSLDEDCPADSYAISHNKAIICLDGDFIWDNKRIYEKSKQIVELCLGNLERGKHNETITKA